MQVINDPGRAASLGQAMGGKTSDVLNSYLQSKLQKMTEHQASVSAREEMKRAGYSPQETEAHADKLSVMPIEERQRLLSKYKPSGIGEALSPTQQLGDVSSLPGQTMQQPNATNQLKPFNPMDEQVKQHMASNQPQQQQAPEGFLKPTTPNQAEVSPITSPIKLARIEAEKIARDTTLKPAERTKQKSEVLKAAHAEQKEIDKTVKPYVDSIDKKGGPGATTADWTLNRMEKLIDTGKLTGATMYNLRSKMESSGHLIGAGIGGTLGAIAGGVLGSGPGAIIGASTGGSLGSAVGAAIAPKFVGSKEDQEFTKLSRYFLNNMKDIFGARVTQQEMAIYMDSIPTLALDDEGKKAVIRDMRIISDGWRHKKQMKDKIVSMNDGVIPKNIEELVEKASAPYMDMLASKFAEGSALKPAG